MDDNRIFADLLGEEGMKELERFMYYRKLESEEAFELEELERQELLQRDDLCVDYRLLDFDIDRREREE